jgi:ELWxxDGT repeat protein
MKKFTMLLGLLLPIALFAQTLPKGMVNLTGEGVTTTIDSKGNTAKKNMVVLGNKIVFTASNAANGEELWITDGTVSGTKMVKDINPGSDGSDPKYLCAAGGKVYFSATTPDAGAELWVSDGTDAGTMLVADIYVGADGSAPRNITAMGADNSLVVFAADDENSVLDLKSYLYLYDSNTDKVKLLGKDNPMLAGDSYYGFLVPFQGTKVFFASNSDQYGTELFMADTSENSSHLVKDIMDTQADGKPAGYTIGGNLQWIYNYKDSLIVFRQTTPTKYADVPGDYTNNIGEELWFTDGTTTTFLGDLNPTKGTDGVGNGTQYAWQFVYNGKFYFRADDGSGINVELHTSNFKGLAGTSLVSDINAGANASWPEFPAEYKGDMFFQADDGGNPAGAELWSMTPDGNPSLFYDVSPGSASTWLRNCTTVKTEAGKDTLLFFTGPYTDVELWVVTGLDKKAAPVGDMGPGSTNPFDLTGLNSALYFSTGTYPSLFKYEYEPVFTIQSNLISTLNESKSDTATFRLKFINPGGISADIAPWVNFSIAGDWKVSLGGDDPFANTKRLKVEDFQPDMDTVVKVLIGSLDKEAWDQTLTLYCTYLDANDDLDTIQVTAAWETEPDFKNTVLFYSRIGDYSPTTVDPTYEAFGSMQSNTDQVYGVDVLPDGKEVKWGRTGDLEGTCWWDADRFTNFVFLAHPRANNHLTYSYPLESGQYHLLVVMTSRQWTQSRPSVFSYPGYSQDIDIQGQRIIIDKIIDYTKGTDTAFNISWAQSNPDIGLVVGGFMKIGYADEFVSVKPNPTSDNSYSVYPNPSRGAVHIRANGVSRNVNYEIYDMTGKPVQTGAAKNQDNVINVNNLAKGMYFIKLHTESGVETHKLIIQK